MATIPYINGTPETLDLSYGSGMSQEYKVRRVDFEGYSQRAQMGLNSKPQRWQLMWSKISDTDAETLRAFFEGLGGSGIINWAPYGQNQSKVLKWTANGWSAKPSGFLVQDCSITLSQEFDL
jgi:phage-related protein